MNEEKEGEKEKISHTLLHSHTARALCPDSEIMREKKRKRERGTGREWRKKKYIEKKGEYGELPFWEYWVLPRNKFYFRVTPLILNFFQKGKSWYPEKNQDKIRKTTLCNTQSRVTQGIFLSEYFVFYQNRLKYNGKCDKIILIKATRNVVLAGKIVSKSVLRVSFCFKGSKI